MRHPIKFYTPAESTIHITSAHDDSTIVVSDILDGDTMILSDGFTKIRLIGINAPEHDEPYYHESTNMLRTLVEDKVVTLESDVTDKDQYGRLLRYVRTSDLFVNVEQVRLGYARASPYGLNLQYEVLIKAAEAEAIQKGVGIWQ